MPGRELLAATPHHLTNQRLEGWLTQTLKDSQMLGRERLAATPRGPTDHGFEA
jgi:hypothetical protein